MIGCLHLSHKWMAHHRGFQDEFYHDEKIIDTWNSIVNKKDKIFILGDVTMEKKDPYYLLDRMNGSKVVILGNHDMPNHVRDLLNYVDSVAGMIEYKGFVLTHCPIHPSDIGMYRGNIHAHIHENPLEEVFALDKYKDHDSVIRPTLHKYHNVDAHMINYKPKTLEEIING